VIATTRCILTRLFEFLHKLDEIGVYDQSLIFVVADHGEKYVRLDVSAASPALPESEAPHDAANHPEETNIVHHWRGVPLFLAKPLGDRHSLRVSDAPVSLCDIPKSVFDALSIEHDYGCESVFSGRSPRQAPRMHYRYPGVAKRRGLGPKGLAFEKFMVVGHSWLPESWIPFGADAE
jgi:arylsulfatase A-like enzyme